MFNMFLFKKSIECYSKRNSPMFLVHRTLKMSFRKKFIGRTRDRSSDAYDAHLQVIGSGAPDQPSSVILNTPTKNYLFNCGEGVSRCCHDLKLSLKKVNHCFFTQSKWKCIGGVTTIIFMTIASSGFPPTFHGPSGLQKIFQRMIFLSSLGGLFKHRFNSEAFRTTQTVENDGIVIECAELTHDQETAIVYLCKLKAISGKYSLRKSVDKNVPVEMLRNLYRGENVTLNDGTVITPADVQHANMPEVFIMFIDVPNQNFLENLATNEQLKALLEKTKSTGIEVMVHFTPTNTFNTARYQHFMESVDVKRHLIVNDQNKHSSMKNLHRLQSKLHKIEPKVHPLLSMKLDPHTEIYNPNDETSKDYGRIPTLYSKYVLREKTKENDFDSDDEDDLTSAEAIILKELNEVLGIKDEDDRELYSQIVTPKLKDEIFPRILFLGTSSGDSFLLRNSTGILVHLSKNHSILLDCGTGICSQINRFYGDEAPEIYRRIKAVFVSHMHLDHHIGLPDLFRWRNTFLPEHRPPLRIFCPIADLKSWLFFYDKHVEPIASDLSFIDNDILVKDKLSHRIRAFLNIKSMTACPVDHFRKSYALVMTVPYVNQGKHELFKLAYSGDTGFSDKFTQIGQNADLLIHEATYQDELKEIALRYRHSTVSMALEQSEKMRANHTILTHFSARYHALPYIQGELKENVSIAFDFMEVTPNDLPRLNSLYTKYRSAFPEIDFGLQQRTRNYLMRQNELLSKSTTFE